MTVRAPRALLYDPFAAELGRYADANGSFTDATMTAFLILFAVAAPIGVLWWTVRALTRWTGGWRAAALGPTALVLVAIGLAVRSFHTDSMGHGGLLAVALGLCVLASLIAYVLSELSHARARRTAISTAPHNGR